jgi:hypothetical protein
MTIGMVFVACCAACVVRALLTTMMSTVWLNRPGF